MLLLSDVFRSDGKSYCMVLRSEANVKLYLMLKNSNDKHDAEAQEYPSILQEKEAIVTESCFARVIVQHLRYLQNTQKVNSRDHRFN